MADLERRAAPRVEYSGITLVRLGREEIPSVAGNISESGILIFPKVKPRTFDPALELTFTLPRQTCWFTVEGRLVHQRRVKSQLAWGVRFVDPPVLIRHAVREFVELQLYARPALTAGRCPLGTPSTDRQSSRISGDSCPVFGQPHATIPRSRG